VFLFDVSLEKQIISQCYNIREAECIPSFEIPADQKESKCDIIGGA
jgi:hypothetical protein